MGDEGNQSGGQQGGNGGQQQSHMVPEGEGGEGAKSGDQGQGQGGEGSQGQGGAKSDEDKLAEKILGQVQGKLDEQGQKIADRLVGAQPKQLEKIVADAVKAATGGGQQGGNGNQGKGGEGQQQGETGPSEADRARAEQDRKRLVRDARASYRDILSEDVKFMGNFEREAAMEFGSLFVAVAVQGGQDDEEAIGREASKRFVGIMESMRKGYEERVKAGLKKAGVLKETPGQTGGTAGAGGSGQPGGALSQFQAGAKKAQDRFGAPGNKANPNAPAGAK